MTTAQTVIQDWQTRSQTVYKANDDPALIRAQNRLNYVTKLRIHDTQTVASYTVFGIHAGSLVQQLRNRSQIALLSLN